jgi:hypothetical protein
LLGSATLCNELDAPEPQKEIKKNKKIENN